MRIIYELRGLDPTAAGSGEPLLGPIHRRPKWEGFSVDIVVSDATQPTRDGSRDFWEGDAIYIEGRGESVKAALVAALRIVEGVEAACRKQREAEIENSVQCESCMCWYDARRSGPHADGAGGKCDGTRDVVVEGDPS